jgi:hypothetical protein
MASLPRATFLMEHGKISWSETHWHTVPDSGIGLDLVLGDAVSLGHLRCGLFGTDLTPDGTPKMPAIRVSFDDTFRDSLLSTATAGNELADAKGEGAAPPEVPWSVILLRLESSSLYRKNLYLSGVPQLTIIDPPGPQMVAPFQKAFNAWKKELLSGRWGFKVRSKDPAISPENPVLFVTSAGTPPELVIAPIPPGTVVGDQLIIRGGRYSSGPAVNHGTFVVSKIDAGTAQLMGAPFQGGYTGGMFVRKLKYVVVPYTDVIVRGETHRKRGVRSGNAPLGRSRNRT